MDQPVSLSRLFDKKIMRIPDYQRGYAWKKEQLKAFWEDLVNISEDRFHYTGVLTIKKVPTEEVSKDSKEFWLVNDAGYSFYHVVDGQQRLTTAVIFMQALANFIEQLPQNAGADTDNIFITDSLTVKDFAQAYLYKTHVRSGFRTYKFGYTSDDSSQDYLRHKIFGEAGGGGAQETYYTLNLGNAKTYFSEQISELHDRAGDEGLADLYRALTQRLLFNEYIIGDSFDVFVAFETMNNRGKKLSDLELLKNRLIYLSTLYGETKLDRAGKRVLRDDINTAWKEVYYQLGRNKARPLNDDDFLRAHWITYFKYSRQTGRDYAKFLLEEFFIPQRIHEIVGRTVALDEVQGPKSDFEEDEEDAFEDQLPGRAVTSEIYFNNAPSHLSHHAIRSYVTSLRDSADAWFRSYFPELYSISEQEKVALDRLNRIGITYFRPLVMVVLKNEVCETRRVAFFNTIERFIFLVFRLGTSKANYRSSEFYNAARALDRNETTLENISAQLDKQMSYTFNDDSTLNIDYFHGMLLKKFKDGSGYYGWAHLRYVLFEYEQHLLKGTRQPKIGWADLLRHDGERISIEHICPQSLGRGWALRFENILDVERPSYLGSIGNLLLLSASINSSLQDDPFADKKNARYDSEGRKTRNGYSDGSHSEIEVAREDDWGPQQIQERGVRILRFMEQRWNFALRAADREKLLFLPIAS